MQFGTMPIGVDSWASVSPIKLFQAISAGENCAFVRTVLSTLTFDPVWTQRILAQVTAGQIEVRCFLAWLARELSPRTYLEVGVRRGFSMAVVAARCPDVEICGFDSWLPGYGGVENPGPEFVQAELEKVGYRKEVYFVAGDSHKTLPSFFRGRRREHSNTFDMITIDGDHSLRGAYRDLLDTMPHCSVGGVVVFDDIAPDPSQLDPGALEAERGEDPRGWGDLLGVWRAIQRQFTNFRYFEYLQNSPGVGLAVRLRQADRVTWRDAATARPLP